MSFAVTAYFAQTRSRPDRVWILDEWIDDAVHAPDRKAVQQDGRIRRWKRISAAGDR